VAGACDMKIANITDSTMLQNALGILLPDEFKSRLILIARLQY